MQLTLDIICKYLPKEYQTKRYGYNDSDLFTDPPLLYEETAVWESGRLYIARADILPQNNIPENIVLICVGRRLSKEWEYSSNQILLILQEATIFSVFNTVSGIFLDFQEWEHRLLEELARDQDFDIQTILKLGEEKIRNPISVTDTSLCVTLTTGHYAKLSADPGNDQYISEDYFSLLQGICQVERMVREPYLSALSLEDGVHYYCYNLYFMEQFAGCISISETNRPFQKSDFILADYFFRYFQRAYCKYLQTTGSSNRTASLVLHHILDHRMLSAQEESWLTLKPGEAWMFFRLKERPNKKSMPKDYMCAMVNTILPDTAFAVIHKDSIRGLWKCRQTADDTDARNLEAFCQLLTKMEYTAGFSNRFTQIRSIGDQLLEASFTVREYASAKSSAPVHFFTDCVLEYWLSQCTDKLPAEEFFTPEMQRLAESDRQKSTSYLETLRTYLDMEGNVTAAARALYINRSSMIKRLDKIKALLESDLSDPEERLYYSILFRLRDIRG